MKISTNLIALIILLIAYAFSAGRFFLISQSGDADDAKKVVRVTHWQLEPGYRDAMQWAIDQYNELPHVKEANVVVEQAAITEKVYNQFMNVHLISGTAPDIASKGMTQLIKGNNVARYYAAISDYINDPNPYNKPEYLPDDLDPKTAEYLTNATWKDTFIDGMQGGYDPLLDDYYAVPVSTFGQGRLFYNMTLLKEVKLFIKAAIAQKPQPEWLTKTWINKENGEVTGYLPDNQRLRDWLNSGEPPETLGQLMLYCYAVEAYAEENDLKFLVPISGSNYFTSNLASRYEGVFLSSFAAPLEVQIGSGVDPFEAIIGWENNTWSFESPEFVNYFEFATTITKFFPQGFLGLDREQAQRRFILGNAALISAGGWDASSIFTGAANRDNPEDVFEVKVTRPPLPAEDERWAEFLPYHGTEANFKTGVPLALNKQSKNFEWALDFLQFVTSMPVNEELNRQAAWLPAIVGADTIEQMLPFSPVVEGFPPVNALTFRDTPAAIKNQWLGKSKLVMTGDMTYQEFADHMNAFLSNPELGVVDYWFDHRRSENDKSRARDRTISVERFKVLISGDEKAGERERSLFYASLNSDEAVHIEKMWTDNHPDKPFPAN
ncbi:hypothetical protein [Rubellicoccus peritrichatus]|uniref:Uncharacterized protein n=1 Tax=Rubellicoccus peritrichatus TaxID=3080537 RepID=A0AAQ3LCY7_9BACT|nr:hypothetical protein [Puniceicoccus sp. CR14]WOO41278.1 hypothetical protein RZN69_21875 [Puniceicoccus sp. CR14]